MALSDSRKGKLQMLVQSLAKKDFAQASDLLRQHGHSAINRHGPAPDDSKPAELGASETPDTDGNTDASPSVPKSRHCAAGDENGAPSDSPTQDGARTGLQSTGPVAWALPTGGGPVTLADACGGVEADLLVRQAAMRHWLIRKTLAEVDPECLPAAREFAAVLRGARQRVDELAASPALCHVLSARPEDLLFVDIESCGLYGTAVFLVGLMYYQQDQLIFEQHLARDYTEEAAILHRFAAKLEETGVLVSFNGKTFDMNMLRERAAFHGVDLGERLPPHLDLLHESRRRWKGKFTNCKLQTLEKHLCGRLRHGDIPGWAIPDAYHRFVDNGDARAMRDILHHNLLDLLTMAQILTAVMTQCDPVELDRRARKRKDIQL